MAQASNTSAVQSIAAPAGAVGDDCTHIGLWDAETGGTFLQSMAISTNPSALALGEKLEIAAGALVIDQPTAVGETEDMSERAVRGRIKDGVWVQWHTGAPGTAGTTNAISELGRTEIAESAFTVAQD